MLELLLANRVGGVAIGEARRVFDRGILGNERCACGQPFWSCEWWGPVVLEAFGSREAAERVARRLLDAGLLTMWTFPALRFRPGRTARLAELRDAARRVFDACATRADGRWLIDSSKDPSWFELYGEWAERAVTVQIIRDPKAVVYSNRKAVVRPEVVDGPALMPLFGTWRTLRDYVAWNLATAVGSIGDGFAVLRYEDLCRDPDRYLRPIEDVLGPPPTEPTPWGYHSVSGNPLRFRLPSPTELTVETPDDEWRTLSLRTRLAADVVGRPTRWLTERLVARRADEISLPD